MEGQERACYRIRRLQGHWRELVCGWGWAAVSGGSFLRRHLAALPEPCVTWGDFLRGVVPSAVPVALVEGRGFARAKWEGTVQSEGTGCVGARGVTPEGSPRCEAGGLARRQGWR